MNGRIASDAYRPALLTRMSRTAAALDGLVDQALHRRLVGDVDGRGRRLAGTRGCGLLGALQVGDDDARALVGEPVGDRAADPLRRAGDDRDLAVERPHAYRSGEKDVGTRMRFCWVWISGWIFGQERLPVVARLERRPAPLALVVAVVAPQVRVRRERADVRGERTHEPTQHLLLDRDALRPRTGAASSGSLPVRRGSRVLDDQQASLAGSTPPDRAQYLSSTQSSTP